MNNASGTLVYNHLPALDGSEQIIILDPMIATGGTATQTIAMSQEKGSQNHNHVCCGYQPLLTG